MFLQHPRPLRRWRASSPKGGAKYAEASLYNQQEPLRPKPERLLLYCACARRFGRTQRFVSDLDFLEVGIHNAVIVGLFVGCACVSTGLCTGGLLCGSGCLIHLLEHLTQSLLLCLDVVHVAGLDSGLEVSKLCLGIALHVCGQLVAVLLQHLLGLEHHLVGTVADIDLFTLLLIVGSKLLGYNIAQSMLTYHGVIFFVDKVLN